MLEVLLEITKFCDLYLMERVLDDESEVSTNLVLDIFVDICLCYKFSLNLFYHILHVSLLQESICS